MHSGPTTDFSTDAIKHLYRWDEIEGCCLLEQHFELVDGFALIVVFAPDDWAIALLREQLPTMLPEPGAIERIRFDPTQGTDSLAESLMELPKPSQDLRLLWIDADPSPPDEFETRQKAWHHALARLNRYRNTLQDRFSCTLALAMPSRLQQTLREAAPDLWSIRAGVFRIEPPGSSRAGIRQLPEDEWRVLDQRSNDESGDPAETLAEADKLRGKPGREVLLALLLQRAGNQARDRLDWHTALQCLQEAYSLQESVSGDPELRWDIAIDVANVFDDLAKYDRSEHYLNQALHTAEQHFGPEDTKTALTLNNLAQLLQATNRPAEAEPLMRRVIDIFEQRVGGVERSEPPDGDDAGGSEASTPATHPQLGAALNNLAQLLQATNRLAEAEPLMRRALAIDEQSFGAEHPNVATDLNNLAQLLQATNRLAEAEPLMRRALAIDTQSYGTEHPKVAIRFNNLAQLLQATNRLAEAEPMLRRALAIDEQSCGAEHPHIAIRLNNLARLLQDTNRLAEAEPLMRRCLEITKRFEEFTGHRHASADGRLTRYRSLLEEMGLSEPEIAERLTQVTD